MGIIQSLSTAAIEGGGPVNELGTVVALLRAIIILDLFLELPEGAAPPLRHRMSRQGGDPRACCRSLLQFCSRFAPTHTPPRLPRA
jgi:hypothetical protein